RRHDRQSLPSGRRRVTSDKISHGNRAKPISHPTELVDRSVQIMILHTHFSITQDTERWNLSAMTENEGLAGRWYQEHDGLPEEQLDAAKLAAWENIRQLDAAKWAAWENQRSFLPTRPCLLQMLRENGFDCVLEQYDWLGPPMFTPIRDYVSGAEYDRSVFIGVRTGI
ncbi:MAG: hypothetical protein ACREDT_04895, partial [Methylocella sp.]